MSAATWLMGLHLLTAHADGGYESATTGVYVRAPAGWTVGAYRNSYGRNSAYAAWTWSTDDGRWSLTAGLVGGYPAAGVLPMVVPSGRFAVGPDWHLRLSLLPKPPTHGQTHALHLSLERAL